MVANIKNRTIEMSTTEAKKAARPNTKEFDELSKLISVYKNFRIVAVKTDKPHGFSKIFIENYVKNHGSDEQKETLKKLQSDEALEDQRNCNNNYLKVRNWFLKEFGESLGIKKRKKDASKDKENNSPEEVA